MSDPETTILAFLFIFPILFVLFMVMVVRHVRSMRAHRVWMREQLWRMTRE
jgi:hypothetical protein